MDQNTKVEDIRKEFRRQCDAAGLHEVDENALIVTNDHHYGAKVEYRGPDLKPPFHRGIRLAWAWRYSPEGVETLLVKPLQWLKENHGALCEQIRSWVEDIEGEIAGSGMKVKSHVPVSCSCVFKGKKLHQFYLTERFVISYVNEALQLSELLLDVDSHSSWKRTLRKEARAQAKRHDLREDGLVTDTITAQALMTMRESHQQKLVDLLLGKIMDEAPTPGKTWSANELRNKGIIVPEQVETIRMSNGQINGRIKLGKNVQFNRKRFILDMPIPQSVTGHRAGLEIGSLIDHPWVPPHLQISSIGRTQKNETVISIEQEIVHFPSGTKANKRSKRRRA